MSEARRDWKLPKNIRQVGDGGGERKIYIEDYVVTYLNQLAEKKGEAKAVLIGTVKEKNLYPYIFIDGAMEVTDFLMNDTQKDDMEKKIEMQFGIRNIVGWYFSMSEEPFMMNHEVIDIYKQFFSGENQVLMVLEKGDEELIAFLMEDDMVVEQPGYYIYYDKNLPMQAVLISQNKGDSIENKTQVPDTAIHRFRSLVKIKQSENKKESVKNRLVYLAGGFLVMTVLSLGVTMIYNYDRMKEVEESLAQLTSHVDSRAEYVTDKITETEEQKLTEGSDAQESQTSHKTAVKLEAETEKVEEESITEKTKDTASLAVRSSYIVKVGDTLAEISQKYYGGTERVSDICRLNGIDDENTILPGQKILLP